MTCSCYGEDIVEWHGYISDDDRLDSCPKCCSSFFSFFMMLVRSDLSVELPYHIEEEDGTEELESRYLHEPDNPERKYNTQNRSTSHSPKYRFFSFCSLEFLRCHPDQDSIVTAHHEVDHDDVEECKCSCRGEEMSKVRSKGFKHRRGD